MTTEVTKTALARSDHGLHRRHQEFVDNFVNASRGQTLAEAVLEWQLHDHAYIEAGTKCNVCDTKINEFIHLVNMTNGNELIIGKYCYNKFLRFLASGKLSGKLQSYREECRRLRKYFKDKTKEYGATFLEWFEEQHTKGTLPADILTIMTQIKHFGYAPCEAWADRLIDYYKDTRKFLINLLMAKYYGYQNDGFSILRHRRFLPTTITINEKQRLLTLFKREAILQGMLHARGVAYSAPISIRPQLIIELNALRQQISAPQYQNSDEALYLIWHWVEKRSWVCKRRRVVIHDMKVWVEWESYRWNGPYKSTNNAPSDDIYTVYIRSDFLATPGIYTAYVKYVSADTIEMIEPLLDDSNPFIIVHFCSSSRNRPGRFVGRINGKIVLPGRGYDRFGRWHALCTLSDEGNYYRASIHHVLDAECPLTPRPIRWL